MKIYRNKFYNLYRILQPFVIIAAIAVILLVKGIIYLHPVVGVSAFLFVGFYIFNPTFNSAPFHKVQIRNGELEIYDKMLKIYIKLPSLQRVNINEITDIFWSSYDLKSSIRTTRFKFNKNSSWYDYIISKNPRIVRYLVFRVKNEKNAYMRYFESLSLVDQIEILETISKTNPNIKYRLSPFEQKLYNINNCA